MYYVKLKIFIHYEDNEIINISKTVYQLMLMIKKINWKYRIK